MSAENLQKIKHCKKKLIDKGMTQKEAAKTLGITYHAVHFYIHDKMTSKRLDKFFGWENENEK